MTVAPVGIRRRLMKHPLGWLAAGFGSGFSPWAPGTVGSAAALLPWWFLMKDLPLPAYLAVLAAGFALGCWAAHWVIRETKIEDPSLVVWDEFIGLWIALLAAPAGWPWMLWGVLVTLVPLLLTGLIARGQRVTIVRRGKDGYGRTLATVQVDGVDAGEWLVKQGLARWWR